MRIEAETLRDLEDSVEPIAAEPEQKGSAGAVAESPAPAPKPEPRLYRVIWRWHFYAGLLTLPVLLTAAVTGGLYVFREELERVIYPRLMFVEPQPQRISYNEQLANVAAALPAGATTHGISISDDLARATRVSAEIGQGHYVSVFVNQHTGQVLGQFESELGVDEIIAVARREQSRKEIYIDFPRTAEDSFKIEAGSNDSPSTLTLLRVDQYSGSTLEAVRWRDISAAEKVAVSAYAIHIGSIYGLPTKILAVLVCLMIVAMSVTGAAMWWVRRPRGKTGFPIKPAEVKPAKWVIAVICLLGVLMPAAGISMILILVGDWLLLYRHRLAKSA